MAGKKKKKTKAAARGRRRGREKRFRILSLDGGGIRGIITAVWLAKLEEELGSPIAERFDLIAGTSTGSILACAVASGIPASEIAELYAEHGRTVFPPMVERVWSRVTRLLREGPSAPRYDGKGLERVLRRRFGDLRFGELRAPTLVTSYNTRAREAVVFKTMRRRHRDLLVWEVVQASCAAPVYFPAHVVEIEGVKEPLIDGGVVATNPTACAIAEGVAINQKKRTGVGLADYVVVSMGTGSTTRPITAREAREWGALEWAVPIIDVLMDGAADAVDYIARHLVPEGSYFRLQTPLDTASDDLDDASPENLNALRGVAVQYLRGEGLEKIRAIAKRV